MSRKMSHAHIRNSHKIAFISRSKRPIHAVNKIQAVVKTDLGACHVCWYDTEPIAPGAKWVGLPVAYQKKTEGHQDCYLCTGKFCGPRCALAFTLERKIGRGRRTDESASWLQSMWRAAGNKTQLEPANHWSLLKKFGGTMTVDEFRSCADEWNTLPSETRFVHAGYTSTLAGDEPIVPYDQFKGLQIPARAMPDLLKMPVITKIRPAKRVGIWHKKATAADLARKVKREVTDSAFEASLALRREKAAKLKESLGIVSTGNKKK